MTEAPLIDSFAEIEDPRHPRNTLYPLEEILLLVICGVLSGADDFVSIADFGEAKLDWLRGLLPFERGIPAHDTLTRVFGLIDPSEFEHCFWAWTRRVQEKTEGEVIAIDGKTLRGSSGRAPGHSPLHLVEAWATGQELMLGQRRSEGGSNEIEAIPELLESLVLEGCVVTIDARAGGHAYGMGCQAGIAEAILDAEADYVLRLKDNQGALRAEVEQIFERCLGRDLDPGYTDVDGGHGRVETRRCWAIDVEGRGLVDEDRWPGLQSVALVETERFVAEPQAEDGPAGGKTETERRYLISSLEADAKKFLRASRRHWRIETQLHWNPGRGLPRRPQPGTQLERSGKPGLSSAPDGKRVETRRTRWCWDANQTPPGRLGPGVPPKGPPTSLMRLPLYHRKY